jgi:hypothetical protein
VWENQSHGQNLRYWVIYINWKLMKDDAECRWPGHFLLQFYLSIKNNWSICEILLQRLVSGRLILHLTITRPSPMFPSLKKNCFNYYYYYFIFFAHSSKRGRATSDGFS